jgi:inhibitor of cysteine peptidase
MGSSYLKQMINLMEKQIRRKAILYGIVAILLASTFAAVIYNIGVFQTTLIPASPPIPAVHTSIMATFPSTEALTSFLKNNVRIQGPYWLLGPADVKLFNSASSPLSSFLQTRGTLANVFSEGDTQGGSYQHSTTNVQVTGVDEADTVKTDDSGYMYVLSKDTVYILTAYPATQARVLAKIKYTDMYPIGIYVSGQRLAVIGSQYSFDTLMFPLYNSYYALDVETFIRLYDISDRSNPVLIKDFALTGSYFNSRMIGDYIYLVASKPAYTISDADFLPEIIMNGKTNEIAPTEIHYFNGTEERYRYTTFIAMNIQNATEAPVYLPTLQGEASNMYASQQNMYVTFQDYYWGGNTTIYRIQLQANNMTVEAVGKIPGYEHNQYSMDEYGDYFRIQTQTWSTGVTATNVYVLDMNLTIVGTLENIAPGENFHSARFMGDRCYLVTFQKTDPLFVIDLSNATNPQVLGNLTIPGYSDYLHPYDETHLIGVGKNTVEDQSGYFAWYQGIKISLFDVTNVTNPIQDASYVIGDRGSDTPVLSDPKAFLFDRSKSLLVIPVLVANVDESKYTGYVPPYAYGDPVWQGAYVFDISLFHNLIVEGQITHIPNGTSITDQAYWIKRSLYIEDVLYTISDRMVKMNSLEDMSEIGQIPLA